MLHMQHRVANELLLRLIPCLNFGRCYLRRKFSFKNIQYIQYIQYSIYIQYTIYSVFKYMTYFDAKLKQFINVAFFVLLLIFDTEILGPIPRYYIFYSYIYFIEICTSGKTQRYSFTSIVINKLNTEC